MASMRFMMWRAYQIALDCEQWDKLSEPEAELVSGWTDGLVHKYAEKMISGRCSLAALRDFDIAEFERGVIRDVAQLRAIRQRLTAPAGCRFP